MESHGREKWDVHHHINPDFYVKALEERGIDKVWGLSQPSWSEKEMLKMMDRHTIEKAFMSISTPGVYFGNGTEAEILSRRCNDFMAELKRKHPSRLGAFATVPLPDEERASHEMIRALDELKLDGLCLLSNVDGYYPGKAEYRSFWEEADKREAIIHIHPTSPPGKKDHVHLNYLFHFKCETTRAIIDFFRSGYHRDFPHIRFILSHGGGVLPAVLPELLEALKEENRDAEREWIEFSKRIYLDTALTGYRETFPFLLNHTGTDNILFGSDWCWAKQSFAYVTKELEKFPLEENRKRQIYRSNAAQLFQKGGRESRTKGRDSGVYGLEANGSVKPYSHSHTLPRGIEEKLREYSPEIVIKSHTPNGSQDSTPERTILVPDFPEVWTMPVQDIANILRIYNDSLSGIGEMESYGIKMGIIDGDNPDQALKEIDYSIRGLKLDGICLFINLLESDREKLIDERILAKLAEYNVPVLLHPKFPEKSLFLRRAFPNRYTLSPKCSIWTKRHT